MKRIISIILTMVLLISGTYTSTLADKIDMNNQEYYVCINDVRVPAFISNNKAYVSVDAFEKVGYNVDIDKSKKLISIYQNPNKVIYTEDLSRETIYINRLSSSKYKAILNNCEIETKEYKKSILIEVNSFIDINGYSLRKNYDSKDDSYEYEITNESRFENFHTTKDKTYVKFVRSGDAFYSDNRKVGIYRNNVEWINLRYIEDLLKFDEVTYKERDEENKSIWYEKDNFEIDIEISEHPSVEVGNYYFEPMMKPILVGDDYYMAISDATSVFNLQVDRGIDMSVPLYKSEGYGNQINSSNISVYEGYRYILDEGEEEGRIYRVDLKSSKEETILNGDFKKFIVDHNRIYVVNLDYKDDALYSYALDGSDKKKIIDDQISEFFTYGDKIYFTSNKDDNNFLKFESIDKSGTNRVSIIERGVSCPIVIGEWVYYINIQDDRCIYRQKLDGSYSLKLNNKHTSSMNIDNGKIYYSADKTTYFMNHDGSYDIKLSRNKARKILMSKDHIFWVGNREIIKQNKDSVISNIVSEEDYIQSYGLNEDKICYTQMVSDNLIFEYDLDEEIVDKVEIDNIRYTVGVNDKYILYVNNLKQLASYDIKDKTTKIILDSYVYDLVKLQDGWIYYINWSKGLLKTKIDGSETKQLLDNNIYDVNIDNTGIYYLISDHGTTIEDYCSVDLDGNNKRVLIDDLVENYAFRSFITDKYVFYIRKDGLYRIDKDGSNKKKIVDGTIFNVEDDGKYLYYKMDNKLYSITYDGTKKSIMNNFTDVRFVVTEDYIYSAHYISMSDNQYDLYRYNKNGSEKTKVNENQMYHIDKLTGIDKYLIFGYIDKTIGEPGDKVIEKQRIIVLDTDKNTENAIYESKGIIYNAIIHRLDNKLYFEVEEECTTYNEI